MEFPDIPEIEMPEEETEYDCDCTCEEQPIITESIGFEDPKGSSVQNDVSTQYDVTIYTEDDFIIAKPLS